MLCQIIFCNASWWIFGRCFDSEVVAFEMLSDDYSKMLFLQCDRYVEMHAQFGRYYRLRIPHFGRDMAYHAQTCDAYFVGDRANVTRLNLEQGRFLAPYETESPSNNVCAVNPEHQLLLVGGSDGAVEAWDPRSRQSAGRLDCLRSLGEHLSQSGGSGVPEVTSLCCRDGLNLAVGTSSGHVQLFDLRSPESLLVKDHMYGLPVKKIAFHGTHDQVLSLDAKCLKIWDRQTGSPYAAIESEHELNDLVVYPDSGLVFMANEQPRLQSHFLPSLGPAPAWCSFLDSITEEMAEDDAVADVYDDYKFVTRDRLVDLGLDHLIGSPLLRAHLHGYFMDVRLYRKAESLAGPAKTTMAESKVRRRMEEAAKKRVELKSKLPAVNKELYLKLKDSESKNLAKKSKKQSTAGGALLEDDRFQDMFKDDKFAIDTTEEAYRLLNPVLSKLDESRMKKLERQYERVDGEDEDDEDEGQVDDDDDDDDDVADSDIYSEGESSSEEEEQEEKVKVSKNKKNKKKPLLQEEPKESKVKFYELKDGFDPSDAKRGRRRKDKMSLEKRLAATIEEDEGETVVSTPGVHQMTFKSKRSRRAEAERERNREHLKERAQLRRSTGSLRGKRKKGVV